MKLNRICSMILSVVMAVAVLGGSVAQMACGAKTSRELKIQLLKAAATLNTVAKENRLAYQSGFYGAVGSPGAIAKRKLVATVGYDANEALSLAVDLAKTLTPDNFPQTKTQILAFVSEAVSKVSTLHVGSPKIDLLLQTVATILNQALILTNALKASMINAVREALGDLKIAALTPPDFDFATVTAAIGGR